MAPRKKQHAKVHKEPLGYLNRPNGLRKEKQHYERIACVFQGGGALGAYQVGAYRAIHEKGYRPNFLAGVSIGSINSAIIAGNPPEKHIEKLMAFWDGVIPDLLTDPLVEHHGLDFMHHIHNRLGANHALLHGVDGFFRRRMIPPIPLAHDTPDQLSYYDTSPLKATLESLIDFDRINDDKGITLCLGAVNITTGQMDFFNNQKITITPEHVMASGALPPGFPAIKIGDDYFWDGGIYANTPLVTVLEALPEQDTLCFMVDCFRLKGVLPQTMDQIEERAKDIRYASHSRRLTNVYASRQNLQKAIHLLGEKLSPEQKKDPEVKKILALGHSHRFSVVHIIYSGTPFAHSYKDYNFARSAVETRLEAGYANAIDVLKHPTWQHQSEKPLNCSIYGVTDDYFDQH